MSKVKLESALVILIPVSLLLGACIAKPGAELPSVRIESSNYTPIIMTQEKAQKMAEEFLRSCPTIAFDGIEDSIKLTGSFESCPCSPGWSFHFEFDCKHPGYGDRTGQVLSEVITHHVAEIHIGVGELAKVTFAIMDSQWDMINQVMFQLSG